MKPEIQQKWVTALRSGEYTQTTENLRRDDGYCCLGVLCDLYTKETGNGTWESDTQYTFEFMYKEENDTPSCVNLDLPPIVRKWAGITNVFEEELVILNDDEGFTFNQIADVIEERFGTQCQKQD